MPDFVRRFRCLIASPGDLKEERQIVADAIKDASRGLSEQGVILEAVRWETDSSPGIGGEPQSIINSDVNLPEIDLCVGIIGSRIGTLTENHPSGTIEEIKSAIERFQNGEGVSVIVYFKNVSLNIEEIDIEEIAKVKEFQKECESLEVYYGRFSDHSELVRKLNLDIVENIKRLMKGPGFEDGAGDEGGSVSATQCGAEVDEDLGFFELEEQLIESLEVVGAGVQEIGEVLNGAAEGANEITKETTGLQNASRAKQKVLVNKCARLLDGVSGRLDIIVVGIDGDAKNLSSILNLYLKEAKEISSSTKEETDFSALYEGVNSSIFGLKTFLDSAASLRETVQGLPNLTGDLKRAKRRTQKSLGDVIDLLNSLYDELFTLSSKLR